MDPAETIHKTIERELHCLPAAAGDDHACRFGFIPASDSLVLSAKKKKEDNEVIHIFRTGANECEDCRNLNGTEISQEEWANKEEMKEKGFPFTENGQYVPHPNCKCHWEEKIKSNDAEEEKTDFKRTAEPSIISDEKHIEPKLKVTDASTPENIESSVAAGKNPGVIKFAAPKEIVETKNNSEKSKYADLLPHTYGFLSPENASSHDRQQAYMRAAPQYVKLQEVEFRVKDSPGRWGKKSGEETIDGFEDLLEKIEKRYKPHSISHLRIMGHGRPGDTTIGVVHPDSFDDLYRNNCKRSRTITARLKNMLSDNAVLEFRMCDVGLIGEDGKNGPAVAQKIANHLGCRVKVFTEKINPYGGKNNIFWFIPARHDIYKPKLEK